MTLDEYIIALRKLNPSEDDFKKAGFTTMPNDILKNYIPDKLKNGNSSFEEKPGLIFELYTLYDPRYFSFADFTFYDRIQQKMGVYIFSGSSFSELAFKDANSEVIEYDRDEWSILNYCAKNTEAFLEALLVIFEMYSLRIKKIISRKDIRANSEYIERCCQIAGGNRYKRFYQEIVG